MTSTNEYAIIAGPSKFDLMASLFEGKRVIFTVMSKGGKLKIKFHGKLYNVGIEDGSYDSWLIRFYGSSIAKNEPVTYDGYYCTRTRKGYLKN
jgi:hypothetical protein